MSVLREMGLVEPLLKLGMHLLSEEDFPGASVVEMGYAELKFTFTYHRGEIALDVMFPGAPKLGFDGQVIWALLHGDADLRASPRTVGDLVSFLSADLEALAPRLTAEGGQSAVAELKQLQRRRMKLL